jgi:hypothetical protein
MPGTDQAVQGYRCAAPPSQGPPRLTVSSFEPVWRTYRDSADDFAISLPATWDGVVLDRSTEDRDLADATERDAALAGALRTVTDQATPDTRFVALDRQAAVRIIEVPAGTSASLSCAATAALSRIAGRTLEGPVRLARVHLQSGDADELVWTDRRSVGGQLREVARFDFLLRAQAGRQLVLAFTTTRAAAGQYARLFWKIAESVRLGRQSPVSGNPTSSCLYADPLGPGSGAPAGGSCSIPVGRRLTRLDCVTPGAPATRIGVAAYDVHTLAPVDAVGDGLRGCSPRPGAGTGVELLPNEVSAANLVVAVDFRFPTDNVSAVGIAIRQASGESTYVNVSYVGALTLAEHSRAGSNRTLRSELVAFPRPVVHRLVLSANERELRSGVDETEPSAARASLPAHPGAIQVYLAN